MIKNLMGQLALMSDTSKSMLEQDGLLQASLETNNTLNTLTLRYTFNPFSAFSVHTLSTVNNLSLNMCFENGRTVNSGSLVATRQANSMFPNVVDAGESSSTNSFSYGDPRFS